MKVYIKKKDYDYTATINWDFFNEKINIDGYSIKDVQDKIYKKAEELEKREELVKNIFNKALFNIKTYNIGFSTSFNIKDETITLKDKDILCLIDKISFFGFNWDKSQFSNKDLSENLANLLTKKAIKKINDVNNLFDTMVENFEINTIFREISINKTYVEIISKLKLLQKEEIPLYNKIPEAPNKLDNKYKIGFSLFKTKMLKKASIKEYEHDYSVWLKNKVEIENKNSKNKKIYEKITKNNKIIKNKIENIIIKIVKNQTKLNQNLINIKKDYILGIKNSIEYYNEILLRNSKYPDFFPKQFNLQYNPNNKIIIVDYSLPNINSFPTLNEVRYIKSKHEFKEFHIKNTKLTQLFDYVMYVISLRSTYEILQNDKGNYIDAVSFNGWVNCINRATGKKENNCILSIQIKKDDFRDINLKYVDPKVCFKSFKGIGSSKLSGIIPIQPILQMDKTDKRFTNSYEVVNKINTETNLAAMSWEDFEHLIREIFEKEFSINGGEVKITQASKDGGVDAVAFDPDPIRGGKIVIQAKRYTNTVGVSAVRDLYGTIMNEGATKGILVTTADYGPDAYKFSKGKPITLLNGANLLHLLEKHGHKARIDIKEAKKLLQ